MSHRVLILDGPRGGLEDLARRLQRVGVKIVFARGGLPPSEELGSDLLGAVVHFRRKGEILDLRSLPGLAELPVILWYPARAPAKEMNSWWDSTAQDLLVGPADAQALVARFKGFSSGQRARQPWMQEAMNGLFRINRAITARADDATVLSTAARELERLFPGVHCVMLMVDAGGEASVISQGDRPDLLNIRLNLEKYPEIKKVMSTRKTVSIRDVRRNPMMKEVRDLIKVKDIISILAVPIFHLDDVIGLIMLRSPGRPRVFSRSEVAFCEMVAQSAAVAVHNLRLGREVAEEVKRSREAIRLAKKRSSDLERMETMFDHASDGIIMVDARGRVKSVNVNFTRLAGYSREEVLGRAVEDLLLPGPGQSRSIMRALKDRDSGASRLTQALVCRDQSRRFVAVRVEQLPRQRDRLISMHDITEERELDDALRRTKEFLENVIQASMDAILAADMNGIILLMNRAAENISGYRSEEVVGKMSIVEFYAPGVARDIMRKLRSDDYGGKGKLEACYNTLVTASGEEVPINISASIIYEEGREVASVGIFQDLRERIRIEKELREAQDRLVNAQRKEALVALSGAAAHELNQPLTSILGYAELLRRVERTLTEEMPDHPAVSSLGNATSIISREAERMADVVRKIGEVRTFETRDYVGGRKIVDLDRSRGEPEDEKQPIWQHLFQNMGEAVAVVGVDGQVIMVNPAAVVMTGGNPIGFNFTHFFKGIEFPKATEAFERVRNGETVVVDLQASTMTGELRMIHFRAMPLPGRSEILVIYSDITEVRMRETALRGLSAFQSQFLKSSTLTLIITDVDGRITFWNKAAERLFGYTAEDAIGRRPDFIYPEPIPAEAFREYMQMVRHQGDQSGEAVLQDRQGRPINVFHVDAAMRDDEGLTVGYMTMIFDLTRQKAAERELQEKTGQIAVMSDIAESIRSGVGLSEVLGGVLRKLARVFPIDLGAITIHDDRSRDVMIISYSPEKDAVYENTLRLYADNDNMRRLLFMEQPAIVDDVGMIDGERFAGELRRELEHMKDKGLRAMIMVPLIFRGEVLGTLHVLSKQEGRYQHEDLDRISQLAGPITMALANARLFNQIQLQNLELSRRTAWMEELIRAGQEISLEMKPEEAIGHLVKPYFAAHSWQHLAVYQASADRKQLRLMAALNYPSMNPETTLGITDGLLKRLQEGHGLLEADLSENNPGFTPLLVDAKTALLVPMAALDRWIGLIVLESHHLHPFTENEKLELQVLAAYVAGVLRNLQFYGDLDLSLRMQRAMIENANALIFILDPRGRVALVNRALQELIGVNAEEILGLNYHKLFERHLRVEKPDNTLAAPDDTLLEELFRQVEQGESQVNLRITLLTSDGRQARCVFNTSSILDRDGRFQGFIAIGQNITRYQELEKYVVQAEKLATIGQMAPGVAHELNNPLTGILTAADMLARRDLDDRSRRLVEQLTEEAHRIETLAHNLMSYSRPSREEMFPLDLRAVVVDSLSFSRYEIQRGQVEVEVKIPSGLPPVYGIKDQLQQVFINLLTNASHACAEKGRGHITISAKAAGPETVEVRVKDTGVGIIPENLPRLFDPFFTTKPEGRGTGLGLSIVSEIISRHHGSVRAESVPGHGSTFILTLPVYHYQPKS